MELFSQRARAVKADFAITETNAGDVVEICRRFEGLPLAIELAAARIKLFSPQAMLARLNNRLQLLTGGARDLPERQQTMRSAIAWSYDLLEEEEKKLFRRLSIFVDGCTSEAAEAVCNAEGDLQLDVIEGLASLVDKSLQRQEEQVGGVPRFRTFETIKEYGREYLSKSGEATVIRREHAKFFLKFAEQIEPELVGSNQEVWLDRLEAEHENLRAALEWCIETGEIEMGLRLGGAFWRFWSTRGYLTEGRDRLAKLLAVCTTSSPSKAMIKGHYTAGVLAEALNVLAELGKLACDQGDCTSARALYEESMVIFGDLGDIRGIARLFRRFNRPGYCARSA